MAVASGDQTAKFVASSVQLAPRTWWRPGHTGVRSSRCDQLQVRERFSVTRVIVSEATTGDRAPPAQP